MAGEIRIAVMDASGNVLECCMCRPEKAAEWVAHRGADRFEEMDHVDGKLRMVEPADRVDVVARSVAKGAGRAAVDAFWSARALQEAEAMIRG